MPAVWRAGRPGVPTALECPQVGATARHRPAEGGQEHRCPTGAVASGDGTTPVGHRSGQNDTWKAPVS
ncbi:MAG TPA: hypothetical protein VFI65_12695 [Streptosporangiaceae bacterium]|nr:hypothetical protein [Streptosporangiaceae bacterium]